jgi:thiol:disulfide interchange protein DsbC
MKTFLRAAACAIPLMAGGSASAGDVKAVQDSLKQALPNIKIDSIEPSPISGLYEVSIGPKIFYVSEDGKYLVQGALVDIKAREDLTEKKQAVARIAALDKVGTDQMVVFKPKEGKFVAYVFTDIDCGYCRKLHSEIDEYLKRGIEIRYLFFPRAGAGSDSYFKAVSVWCAKDRNQALTKAKKGENLEKKECKNPVDQHMALGTAMGANGTPMIVTDKGTILPGYVPAEQLAKILGDEKTVTP